MLKKLVTVTVLGVVAATSLFASGCTATGNGKPEAVTASYKPNALSADTGAKIDNKLRYTDQKGRYRADLEMMGRAQRP